MRIDRRLRHAITVALAVSALGIAFLLWRKVPPPSASPQRIQEREQSLLDQVQSPANAPDDPNGPVATNDQLEKQFALIQQNQQQVDALKYRAASEAAKKQVDAFKSNVEKGKTQIGLLNLRLAAFEKDLAASRQRRPNDPAVQWLTGELLTAVGGEPEQILPYFQRAAGSGLERPQLLASMAKVEFDLNRFPAAYDTAAKAVTLDTANGASWEIYRRAAFALERFAEVSQKLAQAFPNGAPEWAAPIGQNAAMLQIAWLKETRERKKEDAAGDLPLVRLTIEHRAFVSNETKTTGRGAVTIALFENQAPATVANFINLAEKGFYDGTLFYWAEAGHIVVGGDPNTKNDNPADDGTGGPGYVIPDEYAAANTRPHFRGVISTVQNGPRSAGSQFFLTLVPAPEFDGNSTAFGRVMEGQDVLDQVTEGRTNREVGQFGKIIPGDRIVRVEVLRKRAHVYTVTKIPLRH